MMGMPLSGIEPHQWYVRVHENPATWGSSVADLPTTFAFTGQREAPEIGLMYYVARW